MSLREELERAMQAQEHYEATGVMPAWAKMAMVTFLRDHGQALLEAVDHDDSYKADEFGLAFVNGMGWVVQCSRAISYVAELAKVIDFACSKTVDGGGA